MSKTDSCQNLTGAKNALQSANVGGLGFISDNRLKPL